jgi:cytochrome c-type biogenesis protein CcmF
VPTLGTTLLSLGFVALLAAIALAIGTVLGSAGEDTRRRRAQCACGFGWLGCAALAACLILLVWCFLVGDHSIRYVVYYRSDSTSAMAWLYQVSGLWGGREGSLLLWGWLESAIGAFILTRAVRDGANRQLHGGTAALTLALAALFSIGVLVVPGSQLFAPLPSEYLDVEGNLTGQAALWGLSSLLEHWAMVVHPPLLFMGYAAMTIPAAYGAAALVAGDVRNRWVHCCLPWAIGGWLFLGAGIGMGAVWAYTVLGWGGFWGWDPVENASLLPWLAGVALVHSLGACDRRGLFPRWTVAVAFIALAFVMFAAFVTRSGIIGSVHAFDGDVASAWLFGLLMTVPPGLGLLGLWANCHRFGNTVSIESFVSKAALLYLNDVVVLGFAVLLAYLVLAPALPAPLPFAGRTFSADAYGAIARPLGVLYLGLVAMVPLVGWRCTSPGTCWRRVRGPLVLAALIFGLLLVNFCVNLLPAYDETLVSGGAAAESLLAGGPSWYYHGLAVAAFLVSSFLFATAAFSLVHLVRHGGGYGCSRLGPAGAAVAHGALALILVGLVGSTMYVSSKSAQLPYDEASNTAEGTVELGSWALTYEDSRTVIEANRTDLFSTAYFAVTENGVPRGIIAPSVQLIATTQQHQLHAAVVSAPLEDLFVTYQGVNTVDDRTVLMLDVSIHPLVASVWTGFALLMLGTLFALLGTMLRRNAGELGKPEAISGKLARSKMDDGEPSRSEASGGEPNGPETSGEGQEAFERGGSHVGN